MQNKKKFTKKITDTEKFEYNNFIKKYFENYPETTMDKIIEKWRQHKEKRNNNRKLVIKEILKLKYQNLT